MEGITIDVLTKRVSELEKKLEKYFNILKIQNELDFILNGTYVLKEELNNVISGNY